MDEKINLQGPNLSFSFFNVRLCPTPCNPMGSNLPGSSVYGIFQARILEWVAISSRQNQELLSVSLQPEL